MTKILVATTLALAAAGALASAVVGQPAPAFSAVDTSGKAVSLADFKGKHVVLEWINPGCPFVQKHYGAGNMQATQKEATASGVVWLAVNSTATDATDYLSPDKMGAWMREQKAAATANIHVFEKYWDLGFRTASSGVKPVNTLADLQGLKIRVPVLPMLFGMFKALGAAPVSMNSSEIYTSMQTRLVDGQENPLVNVWTAKFYEVQKFVALTNHSWEGMLVAANRSRFTALPADVQEVITRNINAAALREREDMSKLTADVRARLEGAGLKFNAVDVGPFRDRLKQAGYYAEWRQKMGEEAWGALEKYAGRLA